MTGDSVEDLPKISSLEQLREHAGVMARIEGRYDVCPVAGSKRLQPVVIVLDDGTRLLRAYRPIPSEFGFIDRRVHLTGRAGLDSGQDEHVQQVEAPQILEVSQLELAPGEKALNPVPDSLPAPPRVVDAEGLALRRNLWARVVGNLALLEEKPNESFWGRAEIELEDASLLTRDPVPMSRWADLRGRQISAVGRVEETDAGWSLVGMGAICAGDDEECGRPPN
ncbi:MAG: hypothetical protein JRF33_16030 [Deltaproteobacteria bacterium]|nr:hypothetical protein [Deltaproteobacteria bacterium]